MGEGGSAHLTQPLSCLRQEGAGEPHLRARMASCQRLREGSDGAGNGGYGVLLRVRMRHSMGRERAGGGRHTCCPHTDALGSSQGPAQQQHKARASGAVLERRAGHASMRACGARGANALSSAAHAYSSLPQTYIQLAVARGDGGRAHLAAPRRAPEGLPTSF